MAFIIPLSLFLFGTTNAVVTCGENQCQDININDDVVICSGLFSCQNANITADRVICSGENSCRGVGQGSCTPNCRVTIDAPFTICSGDGACGDDRDQGNEVTISGNVECSGGTTNFGSACARAIIDGNALCSGQNSCGQAQVSGCAECSGDGNTCEFIQVGTDAICSGDGSCSNNFLGNTNYFNTTRVGGNAECSGSVGTFSGACTINVQPSAWQAQGDVCCTCNGGTPSADCCDGGIYAEGSIKHRIICPFDLTCDVIIASNSPTTNPTANPTLNPVTAIPTSNPTSNPTANPTLNPVTANPTSNPTLYPTLNPTTGNPTANPSSMPTTAMPTDASSGSNSDSDSGSGSASGSGSDSDDDNDTPKPTDAPTPSPSPSPIVPTTASPTSSSDDSESDDSDSDDSSDDDDMFSAFSAMFGAKQDDSNLDATLDDGSAQQMKISLSDSTLMNLWLMIGLCLIGNAMAFCLCRGKGKAQQSFEDSNV